MAGLVLLQSGASVPENVSRTMLALTCFMIFVHSRPFVLIYISLFRALMIILPIGVTSFVFNVFFGKMCQDIYKDVDQWKYFSNFRDIVLTTFQLFTSEGWEVIMWNLSHSTNVGTAFLFCVYVFISSLLFGQLILGVIAGVFQEVAQFSSTRIHALVAPHLSGLSDGRSEALLGDFSTLSYQLSHLHESIEHLGGSNSPPVHRIESSNNGTLHENEQESSSVEGRELLPL